MTTSHLIWKKKGNWYQWSNVQTTSRWNLPLFLAVIWPDSEPNFCWHNSFLLTLALSRFFFFCPLRHKSAIDLGQLRGQSLNQACISSVFEHYPLTQDAPGLMTSRRVHQIQVFGYAYTRNKQTIGQILMSVLQCTLCTAIYFLLPKWSFTFWSIG